MGAGSLAKAYIGRTVRTGVREDYHGSRWGREAETGASWACIASTIDERCAVLQRLGGTIYIYTSIYEY
jgi:hypothetical protein